MFPSNSSFIMFLILLATTFLAFLVARQFRKTSRLPPGPVPLPLIGNLHQIIHHSSKCGGIVPMMSMYRKIYGDVFTLWLGPFPHVSICDYETTYEVFVKNGSKFADRFVPPIFEHFSEGRGVFATNGEKWQEMRRFSLGAFRNMGMGRDLMEQKIMEELNSRCEEIDEKAVNGVTVEYSNALFDITVGSIINSMLVGTRFTGESKSEFEKLKELFDESVEKMSALEMVAPVWFLKTFCAKNFNFQVDLRKRTREYVSKRAIERIRAFQAGKLTIDPENPQDLVDAFILKMQSNPGDPSYSEESLKSLLLDLWVTGQETTATTLVAGFNQLMNYPKVMDTVRDELMIATNGGSRPISLKDKNETPYFNATLNEIHRHASILNVNFWKYNHEMTTMGGHPVDGGALITSQLSVFHENEEIFENPTQFDPSRFIRNPKLGQQVMPFGIGKRSCLGESLARAEMYLIIGNLLLRYKFRPSGEAPPMHDLAPFGFAKRPFKPKMEFIKI